MTTNEDPTDTVKPPTLYTLMVRNTIEVNTDPQRRCYNGAHARSELRWTGWVTLELNLSAEKTESKLKFWRELNEYAVSQRGSSATSEFKLIEELEE